MSSACGQESSIHVADKGRHQPGRPWHPAQPGGGVQRASLPCPVPKSSWVSPGTPAPAGSSPAALFPLLPSFPPLRKHQRWSQRFTGLLWGPTSHSHSRSHPQSPGERHQLLQGLVTVTLSPSQARGPVPAPEQGGGLHPPCSSPVPHHDFILHGDFQASCKTLGRVK